MGAHVRRYVYSCYDSLYWVYSPVNCPGGGHVDRIPTTIKRISFSSNDRIMIYFLMEIQPLSTDSALGASCLSFLLTRGAVPVERRAGLKG